MYHKILQLLNIKPSESALVRELFTIQFFLGIATAFLFTASLAIFISNYEITVLPVSYILSACLLFVFNRVYSFLDERLTSPKLLQVVILFCAGSIFLFWLLLKFFPFRQLPLIMASWYILIYMLVGYAFWGMASIIFNVRESKRLFSIVGAGDIPAKMLGYLSLTIVVPFIGNNNLLWVSIVSFMIALYYLRRFRKKGLLVEADPNAPTHGHDNKPEHSIHTSGFITKFFDNPLVFSIALLSLVSYMVFSLIDFTFLSDIKTKYTKGEQIAVFIGVFFAIGRFLAIGIKILFSSRMISRIGLSNSLLVTPLLLLIIDFFIILSGDKFISHLYIFGFMVLLTEILRSALQEPVFFILFQPLKPHDRLRGHLIAKGHTLPFALLAVGSFLVIFFRNNSYLPVETVGKLLIGLILFWIAAVFVIKKQYLQTLINSLKKGYFTGAELFLNDSVVTNLLIKKTESEKPLEVIHSLNLLERSGYTNLYKLLLQKLQSSKDEIKDYVLNRIIANNMQSALPIIKQQLENRTDEVLQSKLIKSYYFLNRAIEAKDLDQIPYEEPEYRKAALEGLLNRKEEATEKLVIDKLISMAKQGVAEKLLVLDIMFDCQCENYNEILEILLSDSNPLVCKRAIEAAGKVKSFDLFPKVVAITSLHKAFASFKRSVGYYGDELFAEDNWQELELTPHMMDIVVSVTGTIKGDFSTNFIVDLLKEKKRSEQIIEALWLKKAKISGDALELLENWIDEKINQGSWKMEYYYTVHNDKSVELLGNAIMGDIRKDAQVLLKGFALFYDREKVDRVIELLALGNTSKISNAIEVLEIIIPKKYFVQLNSMVELIDDVQHKKTLLPRSYAEDVPTVIAEIIKSNKANFSEWTRSVACFMIPKLQMNEHSLQALHMKESKDNYLFNETRNYVLSILN